VSRIVALSGGVGGAKLALGLYRALPPDQLTVIVNTGDDFEHLGLYVCPDLDTTLYTLAGLANPELGWGRRDETWTFMAALEQLGGESWFRLGDADLALHVERTRRLAAGATLSAITSELARRLGVRAALVPMSDDPVRTRLDTSAGELSFQDYFVRRRCEPRVQSVSFSGAAAAHAAPGALAALGAPQLEAVILCPSNPYLSLDPLLAVPPLAEALSACHVPVLAVTPLVGGEAIKGPTAKIMRELGLTPSAAAIARHYGSRIDGFVLDRTDADEAARIGCPVHLADTLMRSLADRERLAREVLDFARTLNVRARPAT
jgi:LPPG:FO 2-phospho-L-lactate transferase